MTTSLGVITNPYTSEIPLVVRKQKHNLAAACRSCLGRLVRSVMNRGMPRRYRSPLSHRPACRGDKRITTFDTHPGQYASARGVRSMKVIMGPDRCRRLPEQQSSAKWLPSQTLQTVSK